MLVKELIVRQAGAGPGWVALQRRDRHEGAVRDKRRFIAGILNRKI
jgi:hypothetical protein